MRWMVRIRKRTEEANVVWNTIKIIGHKPYDTFLKLKEAKFDRSYMNLEQLYLNYKQWIICYEINTYSY